MPPVQEELVLTGPPPAPEIEITTEESDAPPSAADGVASSLSELRLPDSQPADAAAASAEEPPPELLDDEPATNPKLSFIPLPTHGAPDQQAAREPKSDPPAAVDESELEPAETPEVAAKSDAASQAAEPAAESSSDESASEDVVLESGPPPRRMDSDAPTRPRIELSAEMALAAGRVTSLELPPVELVKKATEKAVEQAAAEASARALEEAPRRGSKVPPAGEPRMISSLTGRRSSIPVAADDDESLRPAVVVTRSKIISDRPPKLSDSEPAPMLPSMRPSRRPQGDEFETLDIEDVEAPLQLGEGEGGAGADSVASKAPPPPPQFKRMAAPAAPRKQAEQPAPVAAAPAPPKVPPPP
ncbi:MAG TPA: hypothetical protein VJV78_25650, partial [Polyangiales bacterium]|nr:hypothetical protein [Polyangiales bacterium]